MSALTPGWFGPAYMAHPDEDLIDTPNGVLCTWCEEAIGGGDIGNVNVVGQATHYECALRAVAGSLAHQLRECSCYRGADAVDHDDPTLSRRDNAKLAAAHFLLHNKPKETP